MKTKINIKLNGFQKNYFFQSLQLYSLPSRTLQHLELPLVEGEVCAKDSSYEGIGFNSSIIICAGEKGMIIQIALRATQLVLIMKNCLQGSKEFLSISINLYYLLLFFTHVTASIDLFKHFDNLTPKNAGRYLDMLYVRHPRQAYYKGDLRRVGAGMLN
jgi:hypothetical protein